MANIKYTQFITLLSSDLGKTEKVTDIYTKAFINRIFKELGRDNTVSIDYFGTFKPVFKNGYQLDSFGRTQWIEPKMETEFSLSERGKEFLNKEVKLTDEERQKLKNGELRKLKKYKRVLLGLEEPKELELEKEKPEKPELEDVFNKVINQIKERNSDLLCEEEEFDDDESEE
jgi:hypothetical protein